MAKQIQVSSFDATYAKVKNFADERNEVFEFLRSFRNKNYFFKLSEGYQRTCHGIEWTELKNFERMANEAGIEIVRPS